MSAIIKYKPHGRTPSSHPSPQHAFTQQHAGNNKSTRWSVEALLIGTITTNLGLCGCARFDYSISHVPEMLLFTADALSRDPIPEHELSTPQKEIEVFVNSLTKTLPASEQRLETYRQAQERDEVCTQLRECCKMGWPRKQLIPLNLTPYTGKR